MRVHALVMGSGRATRQKAAYSRSREGRDVTGEFGQNSRCDSARALQFEGHLVRGTLWSDTGNTKAPSEEKRRRACGGHPDAQPYHGRAMQSVQRTLRGRSGSEGGGSSSLPSTAKGESDLRPRAWGRSETPEKKRVKRQMAMRHGDRKGY